jgi:hypothetical protein
MWVNLIAETHQKDQAYLTSLSVLALVPSVYHGSNDQLKKELGLSEALCIFQNLSDTILGSPKNPSIPLLLMILPASLNRK